MDFPGLIEGVIEATNCELHYIYDRIEQNDSYSWEEVRDSGTLETVGCIGKRPICISLRYARINGQLILFYHATSTVVDWDQIRAWLQKNLPVTAFEDNDPRKRMNHSDATNWSNAVKRTPAAERTQSP
jgi:nitroimidazol reductase NimA-like FMN-containing flavoprotein (pyridoxamine 5'-phosphate oxidase superfamily)